MNAFTDPVFWVLVAVLIAAVPAAVMVNYWPEARERVIQQRLAADLPRRPAADPDRTVLIPPATGAADLDTLTRVRDRIRDLPAAGYLPALAEASPAVADAPPAELFPAIPAERPARPEPEPEWSVTAWTKRQAAELEVWLNENVRSVPVPADAGAEE